MILDGPFQLPDRTQPQTSVVNGQTVTTYPPLPGVHYITTPDYFTAHAAGLGPYKDASQVNLESIYAGDDPAHPTMTVALTFPDAATAASVIAKLAGP